MSEATTETVAPATNGAAPVQAPTEPAKTPETAEVKKPEAPKPAPGVKDWSAITAAEKRLTRERQGVEARAKEVAAKEAQLAEREKGTSAGMEALRKAYNDGDYSKIESEFPDIYKRLTQHKLSAKRPAAPAAPPPVTEEAILAKLEARQKADHEKAVAERWTGIEATWAEHIKTAGEKFPLLAIEWEDDPDLIRNTLRDMDKRPTALTFDAASAEMESWLKTRLERRQKALAPTGQVEPKTPSVSSPGDTAGNVSGSGGPTTLTGRLSQESAMPAAPAAPAGTVQGDDPVSVIRRRQEHEARELERATAEFVARRK